jgi:hypothetical protein
LSYSSFCFVFFTGSWLYALASLDCDLPVSAFHVAGHQLFFFGLRSDLANFLPALASTCYPSHLCLPGISHHPWPPLMVAQNFKVMFLSGTNCRLKWTGREQEDRNLFHNLRA